MARTLDSTARHTELVNSYHAPEMCEKVPNETFHVSKSTDVWALAILAAYCVKGKFPWQKATIMCKQYYEWDQWLDIWALFLVRGIQRGFRGQNG
jgi:hypothetical protein